MKNQLKEWSSVDKTYHVKVVKSACNKHARVEQENRFPPAPDYPVFYLYIS